MHVEGGVVDHSTAVGCHKQEYGSTAVQKFNSYERPALAQYRYTHQLHGQGVT